jgi:hypothetical protein
MISMVFLCGIILSACHIDEQEKAAERYRDLVKSSTGKTISLDEAVEMLKKLESEKDIQRNEIEQTLNLLKAKYDYKPFPPDEVQGKMIFTAFLKDYLLQDDRNLLFVGQLDDITHEEGRYIIHLFAQLQRSDWQGRKKAHFHLDCPLERIESIISAPPNEPPASSGFQKQYFVICKISELYKIAAYSQLTADYEKMGQEILVEVSNAYQIDGELVEILPYPK